MGGFSTSGDSINFWSQSSVAFTIEKIHVSIDKHSLNLYCSKVSCIYKQNSALIISMWQMENRDILTLLRHRDILFDDTMHLCMISLFLEVWQFAELNWTEVTVMWSNITFSLNPFKYFLLLKFPSVHLPDEILEDRSHTACFSRFLYRMQNNHLCIIGPQLIWS